MTMSASAPICPGNRVGQRLHREAGGRRDGGLANTRRGFWLERAMTTDAWYDEQRRLTPDQVVAATFPLTRWGRHGYEEETVRAFLAEVHAEMVRLVNERSSLWQEVQ